MWQPGSAGHGTARRRVYLRGVQRCSARCAGAFAPPWSGTAAFLPRGHGGSLAQRCSPPQDGDTLSVNPPPVPPSVPRGRSDLQHHIAHALPPRGGLPSAPFPKEHGDQLAHRFHFPVTDQPLLLSPFAAKYTTIPVHTPPLPNNSQQRLCPADRARCPLASPLHRCHRGVWALRLAACPPGQGRPGRERLTRVTQRR